MNKHDVVEQHKNSLLGYIKPGDTIYTCLRHVSRSGMYRVIDMYIIRDSVPLCISYDVAVIVGYRYDNRHNGVGISGCGFDVGFDATYNLSRALFRDSEYDTGKDCGYLLNHRWM